MGETELCWGNSPAESFWWTFKHEHYCRHAYAAKAELVTAVDNWRSTGYSTDRRHSVIRMLSPVRYE
ncbi:integrase core domain-containing protein [Nocardia sp. bgisy118]|uniref:integrase core domain-containing protein n=1 Tax=Nocardia sp. bgisy118 TaxID=3413786 RepID=UPI003F4A0659